MKASGYGSVVECDLPKVEIRVRFPLPAQKWKFLHKDCKFSCIHLNMNNIYKISKGQLITLWVFGIIGWLISLDESDNGSGLATFFVWAIPFFLIFYSIGRQNYKKSKNDEGKNTTSLGTFVTFILFSKRVYLSTKKYILVLLCVIVVIGVTIWSVYYYLNRPQVATGFFGVEFGMTPLEVKLLLGNPSDEISPDELKSYTTPKNKRFIYDRGLSSEKFIRFSEENGEYRADILCQDYGSYESLTGVGWYWTEKEVIERLGKPSSVSISSDGLAKTLSFEKWNVGFEFEKGKIISMCATRSGALKYIKEYSE